jgi:predicted MFS family arabinose efflux permease
MSTDSGQQEPRRRGLTSLRHDLVVLGEGPFRSLFYARTVSMLGNGIAPIALAFAVLGRAHSGAYDLGMVLAARSIAQVVFLLYGGVLSDRLSRYRQMMISDLMAFVAQASIAILFAVHTRSLVPVVALSAVNGAASALFVPASRAVIPDVVAPERRQQATALLRLARSMSNIGGAAAGGVLVVAFGSSAALGIDALSYLGSAILLLGLRGIAESNHSSSKPSFVRELREGWDEFRARSWVWIVVLQFSVINLCFTPSITVLGVIIARDRLGGAGAWSLVLSCQAAGLVIGGVVALRLRPRRPMYTAVRATLGFLPPFALLGFGAPLWTIALAMLVNGMCSDIFEVLWETTLQAHIPPGALARVSSYDALGSFVLGPVGLLLVGPVSGAIGTEATLLGAGALILVATVTALCTPAVRRLPPIPDELPTVKESSCDTL